MKYLNSVFDLVGDFIKIFFAWVWHKIQKGDYERELRFYDRLLPVVLVLAMVGVIAVWVI